MKSQWTRITALGAIVLAAGWAIAQATPDAGEDAAKAGKTCEAAYGACPAAASASCAEGSACAATKSECCSKAECPAVAKKKVAVVCPVSGVALKTCPVSGKPVEATLASYHGGKVYLQCGSCVQEFKEHTAKYATKANLQLAATGQARQIACPISGQKTDGKRIVDVAGVKVAVFCGGCEQELRTAKPKDQIELVFGKKAFAKAFTLKKSETKQENTEVARKG